MATTKKEHTYSLPELIKVTDYNIVTSINISDYVGVTPSTLSLIGKCTQLKSLHFNTSVFFDELPAYICQLSHLEELFFIRGRVGTIGHHIQHFRKLKKFVLKGCYFREFPEELLLIDTLEELDLSNCKFSSSIEEVDFSLLPHLRYLNLNNTGIKVIPKGIADLKLLQELIVPKSVCSKIEKKPNLLLQKNAFLYSHSPLEKKHFNTIINYCRRQKTNWKERLVLLHLLGNNTTLLSQLTTKEDLLKVLDTLQLEIVRLQAINFWAATFAPKDLTFLLKKQQTISVIGKIGSNKNELKKKMKELNIGYAAALKPTTTAILIGQLPKVNPVELLQLNIPIITEQQFISFLDEQLDLYLIEESNPPETTENLSNLLLSNQDENILLALTMFKQGGFPTELLTELFIVQKQNSNKEIQKETERLIRQYGTATLIDESKKKSPIFTKWSAESGTYIKLRKWSNTTELDCLKIARYAYQQHGKGLKYLLYKLPSKDKLKLLQSITVQKTQLNLANLALQSIPEEIYSLKDLTHLNLSGNYNLQSISPKIKQLHQLEELNLRGLYKLVNSSKLEAVKQWLPQTRIIY